MLTHLTCWWFLQRLLQLLYLIEAVVYLPGRGLADEAGDDDHQAPRLPRCPYSAFRNTGRLTRPSANGGKVEERPARHSAAGQGGRGRGARRGSHGHKVEEDEGDAIDGDRSRLGAWL